MCASSLKIVYYYFLLLLNMWNECEKSEREHDRLAASGEAASRVQWVVQVPAQGKKETAMVSY